MNRVEALSLLMSFLGFGLSLFLSVVLWRQRRVAPAGGASWGMMVAFGVWHLLMFAEMLGARALRVELPVRMAAYVALAVALGLAGWLMRLAIVHRKPGYLTALGVTLILAVLPLPLPVLTIAPPFIVAYYYHFHHTFGLQLGRRGVFALTLGVATALYLLGIRMTAEWLEAKFQAVGWLVELTLLLWAGILWLPLYAGLSRFLTGRAQVVTELARAVAEEASVIFDLRRRMEFVGREMERRLGFRRVMGVVGELVTPEGAAAEVEAVRRMLEACDGVVVWVGRLEGESRRVMEALGMNYAVALRYEQRLTGMLLVDTSPLAFLEDEELLAGVAPQIAQSLEACRLLEEKIQLERELVRQEQLAAVGKMAATIAHEVKNPLSAIKAIAQLMKEDEAVTGVYAQDLGFIVEQVNRLDQAVRQLLGFAKPPVALEQDVDLSALVRSTVGAMGRQAAPLGVEVRAAIAEGVVLRHANQELAQQIVMNVILNAVQAAPAGSVVEVELTERELRVRDQGPGIPEHLREKVFEPFFTTKTKGTGLGLAIVRKNARLLGGDVEVECPAEGGTAVRFYFTL